MIVFGEIAADFAARFGRTPRVFRAPGRVNLIGEHTDYNDGFVMPAALEHATAVAVAPRADRMIVVHSRLNGETATLDLDAGPIRPRRDWSDYVFGVARMLEEAGHRLAGCDLTLTSTVPIGSGLSSSAALEVATVRALAAVSGLEIGKIEAAKIGQKAENEHVGMRCGIMDQYAASCGVAGHALLIDCRSLEARPVAIDRGSRIVIANSMVHHVLAGGGEYNARRASCEAGVRLLAPVLGHPVTALRDVTIAELEAHRGLFDDETYRRCRHIVTENDRVLAAEAAAKVGDVARFGALMDASHVSMRDDFEISCAEVDVMVDLARALPGVHGARMTGGGFGGCTVSLVETQAVEAFAATLKTAYRAATGISCDVFACAPGAGAGEIHEGEPA